MRHLFFSALNAIEGIAKTSDKHQTTFFMASPPAIPASIEQEAKVWVEEFHNFRGEGYTSARATEFWGYGSPVLSKL